MKREQLVEYLDELLQPAKFRDYCPNGLQVEGRAEVRRVLCGVTASQALLDLAATGAYDAVFVHHGLFWKGDDGRVTGFRRRRLHTLLANDISLFAYHLPLDVHPELGNNAQLARLMGWQGTARFADQELGWIGRPAREGERADEIARALARRLDAQGGAALIVDYGYEGPALGETLQAVKQHGFANPFEAPGEHDLTAHIDFATLGGMAEMSGARVHGPVAQGDFLGLLGIAERAAALARLHPERGSALAEAHRRLTHPQEMGALFRAMALTAKGWPTPAAMG